jgi:hypothetical protein
MEPHVRNFFEKAKAFLTKESTVSYLKDIVKTTLTMLVIGMLLGATAPILGNFLLGAGIIEQSVVSSVFATTALGTGGFFGLFGGIQAAITPIVSKFFNPPKPGTTLVVAHVAGLEHVMGSPSHTQSTAQSISPTHFQDLLANQTAASVNTPGHSVG